MECCSEIFITQRGGDRRRRLCSRAYSTPLTQVRVPGQGRSTLTDRHILYSLIFQCEDTLFLKKHGEEMGSSVKRHCRDI
jgi:hypothetical protein